VQNHHPLPPPDHLQLLSKVVCYSGTCTKKSQLTSSSLSLPLANQTLEFSTLYCFISWPLQKIFHQTPPNLWFSTPDFRARKKERERAQTCSTLSLPACLPVCLSLLSLLSPLCLALFVACLWHVIWSGLSAVQHGHQFCRISRTNKCTMCHLGQCQGNNCN